MTDPRSLDIDSIEKKYQELAAQGLKLDMTRGKPGADQLDLSNKLLDIAESHTASGIDCRNYGGLDGIPEARSLFAPMLGCHHDELIIGGNSSLTLMYDALIRAMVFGVPGCEKPWIKEEKVRFLCPVPGYDRHFAICETLNIEMIPIETNAAGPDLDQVEKLVADDPSIKGMWCVPKYTNPTGTTYSDSNVERLASMKTAAPDFRIWWDNAYAVHHLGSGPAPLKPLLAACQAAGNPNRALMFGSTSKITFAGAGVSFIATSDANKKDILARVGKQTIGPDKLNALRHVKFFGDYEGILDHMNKHAKLLRPKFQAVDRIFTNEISGLATWSKPTGGYFVSLDTKDGLASKVVELANAIGVKLTKAGATFPLSSDPRNRNIRIAPSLPPLEEVERAMEAVAVCVQLATVRAEQ